MQYVTRLPSGNIEGYFYAICDAIAVSTMTFIAANIGAKKKENIKKCAFYGLIWGAVFCVIIALVILLFHRPILSLFVKEEEAIKAGYTRLSIMAYLYFFDFTMAYTAAVLRGKKINISNVHHFDMLHCFKNCFNYHCL